MTLISFKPAPIVQRELHAEWPINLQLDGTYHNLALFFEANDTPALSICALGTCHPAARNAAELEAILERVAPRLKHSKNGN